MIRQHGNRGAILKQPTGPFFEDYVTDEEALPTAPLDVDHVTDVHAFYMYANGPDPSAPPQIAATGVGNCTCAAAGEFFNVTSAFSGTHPGGVKFLTSTIVSLYERFGYVLGQPNTDNGAQLTQVAASLVTDPIIDESGFSHQLAGWSQLRDPTNPWTLRRVMNLTGAVYMGYCLPDNAMQAFDDEQPFTDLTDPADQNEGHCMLYAASIMPNWAASVNLADGLLITWGDKQAVSPDWNGKYAFQALALFTQDYITKNGTTVQGYNLQQMISDCKDAS